MKPDKYMQIKYKIPSWVPNPSGRGIIQIEPVESNNSETASAQGQKLLDGNDIEIAFGDEAGKPDPIRIDSERALVEEEGFDTKRSVPASEGNEEVPEEEDAPSTPDVADTESKYSRGMSTRSRAVSSVEMSVRQKAVGQKKTTQMAVVTEDAESED